MIKFLHDETGCESSFVYGGVALVLLTAAYQRTESVPVMADAAKAYLASLTPEQRTQTMFSLDDAERMNWFYTPVPRKGLPLRDMTAGQRKLALALLSAGLSQRGFIKAATIMSLDDVLAVMEKGRGPRRDPDGYFFSIFGEPSATGEWGYRIDGHHLSQNFTIANGKVVGAPSFFGANPAEVLEGPRKGLRVLAHEDDLGRDLIQSLTPAQQATAIVDKTAPGDILTTNSRKAALAGKPNGISFAAMTSKQKDLLQQLLDEYVYNMPDVLAQAREDQIRKAGNNLWFAWSGVPWRAIRIITAFSRRCFWWSSTTRRITRIISTPCGETSTGISVLTYSRPIIRPVTSKLSLEEQTRRIRPSNYLR